MIRMDLKKLLGSLSGIEGRKSIDANPVLSYLHDIITLSSLQETSPSIAGIDFTTFTMEDLDEYYEDILSTMDDNSSKADHLINEIVGMKALHASKINYF